MSGSQTTLTIAGGDVQTTLRLGVLGPVGPSYPEQLYAADLIGAPTLDATNAFLRVPAADATDAANMAAANADAKAALAVTATAGAQAVIDASANILAANAQTVQSAAIVQSLVSQPDYTQKNSTIALIPAAMAPLGATEVVLDGRGRPIQGIHKTGHQIFKKSDPSGLPNGPIGPPGLHPLAAELVVDGRGRVVRASNSLGISLYAKHSFPPQFLAPAGIIPQGADPSVIVDGRGRMLKAASYTPALAIQPLPAGMSFGGGLVAGNGQPVPGSIDPRTGAMVGLHNPSNGIAYLTGVSPNRQVRAFLPDGHDILISMPGSDPDMFVQNGDVVSYRRTAGGLAGDGPFFESESIAPEPIPMGTSRFAYIGVLGQSNSNGYGIDVLPVITAAVRPGRARMFARGPRIQTDAVVSGSGVRLDPRDTLTLRDLHEVAESSYAYIDPNAEHPSGILPKETPCSGMGWQLTSANGLPATDMLIASTLGVGSITLSNLSKGHRPYWNYLRSVWSAVVKASVRNVPCVVLFAPLIQGESDAFVSLATRTAGLTQLQSDLDADVKALTGQTQNVVLVSAQISSWNVSGTVRSAIPDAALNLAISQPDKFMCSGAMYGFPFSMPNHLTMPGHDDHGEQIGYIIGRRLAGVTQPQVYCTGTTIDTVAKTVRLHMNVQGSIVIDTSVVSDAGNYGITFVQTGGAGEAISGTITTSGADIIVPFSAIPTGANRCIELGQVGILGNWGGPTQGPRTCFQDSVTFTKRDGRVGISRACHQTVYF